MVRSGRFAGAFELIGERAIKFFNKSRAKFATNEFHWTHDATTYSFPRYVLLFSRSLSSTPLAYSSFCTPEQIPFFFSRLVLCLFHFFLFLILSLSLSLFVLFFIFFYFAYPSVCFYSILLPLPPLWSSARPTILRLLPLSCGNDIASQVGYWMVSNMPARSTTAVLYAPSYHFHGFYEVSPPTRVARWQAWII